MSHDRLPVVIAAAAGVAGLAISIYLTVVHYSALPLVCSTTAAVDCGRVLSSGYAVIAGTGVPTSMAGVAWFAVSTTLATAQLARPSSQNLAHIHLVWSGLGLATVLYLVFVEIVQLGAICIWCTVVHILVLVTFLVVWIHRSRLTM
ncbi:MAG TPA: vitamin K epoxide reductase family protein [Candidatus Dormibacteraeota bacterium]